MPSDPELTDALERIERDAWADMVAAAPPAFASAIGLSAERRGDALLLGLPAVPFVLFNRAFGFAAGGAAFEDATKADDAEDPFARHFAALGSKHWAVQVAPSALSPKAAAWLRRRGYAPSGADWAKFVRGRASPPRIETALRVVEAGAERAADFARAVREGYGMPPPFEAWLAALAGRPGWRAYVAYDGARPVAGGLVHIAGETAWLGVAATIASARGRGGQSTIMAARIAAALEAGCRIIATETGVPTPQDPNPSCDNMWRCGFRPLYLRGNYARAAA
jgi:hypothetical protein